MPYAKGSKPVKRLAFDSLLDLAALLRERPEAVGEVANRFPNEMESVAKLSAAPFFRWQPFGLWEGQRYAGYQGDNPCQVGACYDRAHNKWAIAGNRAGKTVFGLMEDVADALGIHVVTKRPMFGHHLAKDRDYYKRKFPVPPVDIWVVSDTEETSVNIIMRTIVEQVFGQDQSGLMWNFVQDHCSYSEGSGFSNFLLQFTNGSTITFKHSSQKRATFQGRRLHKVHHDEVQPKDIYSECIARLVDYNGYFLGTMTPIYEAKEGKGIPWMYEDLYLQRERRRVSFHQWSMLDNPFLSEAGKKELMDTWDEDEIEARVHGAFVPMGVQLAFPNKLLRSMRHDLLVARVGELAMDEHGRVSFEDIGEDLWSRGSVDTVDAKDEIPSSLEAADASITPAPTRGAP